MDNKPFGGLLKEEKKPKNKTKNMVILAIGLVVIILAFFLLKGKPTQTVKKTEAPTTIDHMQDMVSKIQGLETDIQEKQNTVFKLISEYKAKTGQSIPQINLLNLSDEERSILEKKIAEENDISVKSLLKDILAQNKEISDLNQRVKDIEAVLPQPHIVNRGENHFQIAMSFMESKGVDAEKSKELIERSALFDLLMPGFKVWNFYAGDTYGTFVTQGTAPVSPNTVNRKAKKKLIDEKDQAISERDSLALEINDLEDKKNQLISQLEMLNNEKDKMIEKINEMSQINQEMKTDLNSIAYLVDLKENLIKKGIIKGGFLKSKNLNEFKAEDFTQSIDLRAETKINIDAQSLNVKKIRNISLYPKFYKQNVDYSVSFQNENQLAVLTILNPAKLRNEKVVISVN